MTLLPCPFHQLTGFDCPICGAQRMLLALAHGEIVQAFMFNPVLFCLMPYFAIVILGAFSKRISELKITRWCSSNGVILSVLSILVIWGFVRNLVHF